ncbi:QueT transporter family protein [Jeotgalicoccus halotolerans]|uniref:Putative membrane protein n=1 Tax=Jeotgalicoccus halotolerans TaxID=157227 RepID=A0A3E0AVH9_9STAP|nr:QueT transporter family protein [Jeotgalicoccus halotolerans]REG23770.1 putative membrane protein [Jeotgalicoccus halotolerans]
MNIRDMSINAVLAAIYVALTVINPIGTGAIQFRISEILCVIPFFNRKYIPGMVLGVGIANIFSSLGLIDVVVGVTISVIAYTLSYFIKNVWINALQYSVLAGLFVALALYLVLGLPYWFSAVTVGLSTLITTFIGAFIFKKIGHRILPE